MRKKEKKSKKKSKVIEEHSESFLLKDNRIKLLSKVDKLKFEAQKSLMKGNFEDAIYNAEQIIRLAILADMPSYIKEQKTLLIQLHKKFKKIIYYLKLIK